MQTLDSLIVDVNDVFWTYLLIPVVVLAGLWFTLRSRGVQIRLLPEMFRVLKDPAPESAGGGGKPVSSFGAFTISAAARVGTGNIAGVAGAITLGGAGAVFWMWVMALVGAASAFVESTLAQLYKVRDEDGTYRGGPAYYMRRGLKKPWLGLLFAVTITVTFGFVFNAVQSNTITAVVSGSLGAESADGLAPVIGAAVALLLGLVIFGGVRRIASVTQWLVPVMAILYLVLGAIVVLLNVGDIPRVFADIVGGAFGFREVAGGAVGAAIQNGIRRGMFSNEAGLGSAPNAGAAAEVTHPVKQGLVQALGVFFDTLLICTMTAFIILTTNPTLAGRQGADLTQSALESTLGAWAGHALTVVVFMLCFSTLIGNYYYGESNIEYMTTKRWALPAYRTLVLVTVFLGALGTVSVVWNLADVFMGFMALVNLAAIVPLSVVAFRLLEDYQAQRREGRDPVFTASRLPDLTGVECWPDEAGRDRVA